MQAILMGLSICLLGVMVTVLLFSVAMRPSEEDQEGDGPAKLPATPEQFFSDEVMETVATSGTPMEVALLQLEQHVRMEQAAARLFLKGPSAESLQAPSESPLWH